MTQTLIFALFAGALATVASSLIGLSDSFALTAGVVTFAFAMLVNTVIDFATRGTQERSR